MKTVPDFLTREEADAILAVPNKRYPTGHRNYYLIRFLLGSGLRCSEALAVKLTDLDLANRRVKVRSGHLGATAHQARRKAAGKVMYLPAAVVSPGEREAPAR